MYVISVFKNYLSADFLTYILFSIKVISVLLHSAEVIIMINLFWNEVNLTININSSWANYIIAPVDHYCLSAIKIIFVIWTCNVM